MTVIQSRCKAGQPVTSGQLNSTCDSSEDDFHGDPLDRRDYELEESGSEISQDETYQESLRKNFVIDDEQRSIKENLLNENEVRSIC